MYASLHQGLHVPIVDFDTTVDICATSMWLVSQGLDTVLLQELFLLDPERKVTKTGSAFGAQARLIATYVEMTSHLTICSFIKEGLSEGALLPRVGAEIKAFYQMEHSLKVIMVKPCFPTEKLLSYLAMRRLLQLGFQT